MADLIITRPTIPEADLEISRGPVLRSGEPIVGGLNLPALADVQGAVLVEDPASTLVFRRLRDVDVDPDFAILSFAANTAIKEIGDVAVTPGFTAAYTQTPTSAVLTNDDNAESKDVVSTPTAFSSDSTYAKTANNASVQFALTADDGTGARVANTSITWRPRTFFGIDVDGLSGEADIEGLANQQLDDDRAITFAVTPTAGEHIYYAFPSAYGTPIFAVGGIEGGFVLEAAAVSVTNAFGATQDYDLWKSVNPNLGVTTVVVI